MRKIPPQRKELIPIKDRVHASFYGDADLQEKILNIIATALDTEVVVRVEKPYETKKGLTGNYMYFTLRTD